uniref:Uncharacterized protein isoform X2 n=1 Tax=Pogona vitticeps TaxID=103695 RepID=A0ABM5G6A9_9SAUR
MAGRRGMLKRKPNFTLQEIDILTSEVLKYEQLLFGAAAGSANAYEKQKIWWRITSQINAAGRNQRDVGEVKNRWRSLRRRAHDKIARHRLQRQAQPPAERPSFAPLPGGGGGGRELPSRSPELGPEGGLRGMGSPDASPPPGTPEVAASHGVKKDPVKEKPEADVKSEPFFPLSTEVLQRCMTRGAERQLRLLRSSDVSDDPCEGWTRSTPNSSQTELSFSEPGGQQEALGSDYTNLTFDQDLSHSKLKDCNLGDTVTAATLPIQEGLLEESLHFTLAERQIVQSNEQLVQEVRAFRQEYAKSHRETASILHSMAEALSGICSSLSEIRALYLRQQAVPKQ